MFSGEIKSLWGINLIVFRFLYLIFYSHFLSITPQGGDNLVMEHLRGIRGQHEGKGGLCKYRLILEG